MTTDKLSLLWLNCAESLKTRDDETCLRKLNDLQKYNDFDTYIYINVLYYLYSKLEFIMSVPFINSFSTYAFSFYKGNILPSISSQQKKIVLVALAALSCLTVSYLFFHRFKGKDVPLKGEVKIDLQPQDKCVEEVATNLVGQNKRVQTIFITEELKEAFELELRYALDLQSGKFDDAVLQKGLSPDSKENAHRLCLLGDNQMAKGKPKEAGDLYQKALALDPENFDRWCYYAINLCIQGKFEEATTQIEKALAFDPKDVFALRNYGHILCFQSKFEEGAVKFQEVLAINPQDKFALLGYADLLHKQGKFEEAAVKYQEVLAIKPQIPSALLGYAGVLRKQGKTKHEILEILSPFINV